MEDAQNLVAAASTPLQVRFVYLGLYAGLRLSEICAVDRRLVAQGVERDVVGALLGHASSSVTTLHYAPVTWREMVAAVNRLEYTEIALAS